MHKIDFVLPWVDGSDELWQAKKNKFDTSGIINYNNSNMRYRDWGTLRYVLRSIEQNCPWYHKIYIITEGHYPDWLDMEHEKIVLVTHDELYFDKTHLPTFSSSSIEMNLPNIKSLSDKFVYLNDDTLILKPVEQNRFFKNDLPVDFFSHGWLPRNKIFEKLRGMNSWAHSIKNNIDLINREFVNIKLSKEQLYHPSYGLKTKISNFLFSIFYKKLLWLEHYHQPIPYLKQTLIDVKETFFKEMMECSKNRFRANNDLTQYLYRYWQLVSGEFYPSMFNDHKYCKIESKEDMDMCLKEIDNYTFVCPNDSVSEEITEEEYLYIEMKLIEKLNELLPKKASFERQ
jgi:hypothetical protein